jgi:hypothetical protein
LPLPLLPETTASHEALLVARQEQALAACTDAEEEPPLAPNVWVRGDTE